jgi:hypothetical protein
MRIAVLLAIQQRADDEAGGTANGDAVVPGLVSQRDRAGCSAGRGYQ